MADESNKPQHLTFSVPQWVAPVIVSLVGSLVGGGAVGGVVGWTDPADLRGTHAEMQVMKVTMEAQLDGLSRVVDDLQSELRALRDEREQRATGAGLMDARLRALESFHANNPGRGK